MYDRLAKKLLQQLKAYPDELLGVACPTNSDVDNVRTALSRRPDIAPFLGDLDKMHDSEDIERRICICTIHDAKGLEFRAMHIPFAEHVNKMRAKQKKLAFTGATRAKTSLSIYHLSPLPGYLEQARETVSPRKPPPNVGDLFPRRK
jgi:superfamily I DNA/RNA helicase